MVAQEITFLDRSLEKNREAIKAAFRGCSDVVMREIKAKGLDILSIYVDGLAEEEWVNSSVYKKILTSGCTGFRDVITLLQNCITNAEAGEIATIEAVVDEIVAGRLVLLADGEEKAVTVNVYNPEIRESERSSMEVYSKGPVHHFTEVLLHNVGLVRRIIKSPALKVVGTRVGFRSNTDVAFLYVENVADPDLVNEVKLRLGRIDIDEIKEISELDELMNDAPLSFVASAKMTEKPDVVAAALLEGRVAVFADGSPICMIVPTVLKDLLEAGEDSYHAFQYGTFSRLLRYLFIILSLYGSALFVAFTMFHTEMIPETLFRYILRTREEVSLPPVIEVLVLEIVYELVREGSARLPMQVNKAVIIIASILIGPFAAQIGIVSYTPIIVVAVGGITSFTIPYEGLFQTARLMRYPMIILASLWGLYGIIMVSFVLFAYLVSIRSYGVPFMSPYAPLSIKDLKDSIIKTGVRFLKYRPFYLTKLNRIRQGE